MENKNDFKFSRFEVKRPDFNHDGSLFSRHYCLVVEITGAQKRELLAELTLLEPKVFNLISSLSKNEISEPEVFKVLPPLDYEYETMY